MLTIFFIVLSAIASVMALANKISTLAILLYYAECGVELPDDSDLQKYAAKAVKKLFHMPN